MKDSTIITLVLLVAVLQPIIIYLIAKYNNRNKFHGTINGVEHIPETVLNKEPNFEWLHKLYAEEFASYSTTFFEIEVEDDKEFLVVDYHYDNVNVHLLSVDRKNVLDRTFVDRLHFDLFSKPNDFKNWFENIANYHDDCLAEEIHEYKNEQFIKLNEQILLAVDTYKKSVGQSQLDRIQVHYIYTKNSSDQKVFVFKTATVLELLNTVLSDHLNFSMQIEDIDQNQIKLIKDLISDLQGN